MPLHLYWCETWSLTSREEYKLTVFENRVLRKIFWPKRDEFYICSSVHSNSRWKKSNKM